MKFTKLDVNNHDLDKVSKLIYETELDLFQSLFGKNQEKAQKNIKKLIYRGNNSFGHDKIYVVTDNHNDVLGILVSYSGADIKEMKDTSAFFNSMGILEFLKMALIAPVLNKILTTDKKEDDYYLSNISVDKNQRGKGIGTFILKNSFELAKKDNSNRIILDVDIDNSGALRLYERVGFKFYNKKSIKWFGREIGTFNMEYFI